MNEDSSSDSEMDSQGAVSSDSGEYQDLPIVTDDQGREKDGGGSLTEFDNKGSFVSEQRRS